MSKSRKIRKFERLLFRGVTETPEPTFQRRNTYANVDGRQTGMPQNNHHRQNNQLIKVGVYKYDFENEKVTFEKDDTLFQKTKEILGI